MHFHIDIVTNTTMSKLTSILTTAVIVATLTTLAGCSTQGPDIDFTKPDPNATQDASPDTPDSAMKEDSGEETSQITFELPEEWEVKGNSAYLNEQPVGSATPKVELEVYSRIGTQEEAKNKINYLVAQQAEANATFTEMQLGGRNIYIEEESSDLYYGEPIWISNAEFEKDGRVYSVWMTDRVQNREAAIEMLVNTVQVVTANQ